MENQDLRHILEAQQFNLEFMKEIFEEADGLREEVEKKNHLGIFKTARNLQGRTMLSVFYEPSTRTRTSFVLAGQRLGMNVCWTENAKEFSSTVKGETLEDTIRVLCEYYPDVIVLRHHETGAAARAAAVSSVPIINAGDGKGQHPTQALLDIYTIKQCLSRIDGITVMMVGDLLNGRTVRSLAYLLAKFKKVRIIFSSPENLAIGGDILAYLEKKEVEVEIVNYFWPDLEEVDVIYETRIQKERGSEMSGESERQFSLTPEKMASLKSSAIVLHPLPRNHEISPEVDLDPRAKYFRQAGNGMFIRMALLKWVLRSL
ncbi:MAG: aspartate carbamoyltransferase [bacterium]|nr:aspartate carbamoyltransferase [bacterium]